MRFDQAFSKVVVPQDDAVLGEEHAFLLNLLQVELTHSRLLAVVLKDRPNRKQQLNQPSKIRRSTHGSLCSRCSCDRAHLHHLKVTNYVIKDLNSTAQQIVHSDIAHEKRPPQVLRK